MTATTTTEDSRKAVGVRSLIAVAATTIAVSLSGSFVIATVLAPVGPQGARGAQGEQGEQGAKGDRGSRGTRGRMGKTGKTGKPGTNGANGANGATIIRDRACSNDLSVPLPFC